MIIIDVNGQYFFNDFFVGDYIVVFIEFNDYFWILGNSGGDDSFDSDVDGVIG